MSTTMQQIDAKAMLTGWLQGVTGMFVSDVNAIPDDKWTATMGGCTRPCSELADDTISFLVWATKCIEQGGTPTMDEAARAALKESCTTKAGAIAAIQNASKSMADALSATTDEILMKTATAPFGMDGSIYGFAQMAVSHVWYHDGQLNYVQCLLGDGDFHWSH
jgi:hypothetical protein